MKKTRKHYFLVNAWQMHKEFPTRFYYPSKEELDDINLSDLVKVCLDDRERVWVFVADIKMTKTGFLYYAYVDNFSVFTNVGYGDIITFNQTNVYDIDKSTEPKILKMRKEYLEEMGMTYPASIRMMYEQEHLCATK